MHVAIVGGGGTVGATVAYTLATTDPTLDVSLVDVAEDVAEGHAIDVSHGRTVAQLRGLVDEPLAEGRVEARPSEAASFADVDLTVVTASISPPEGAKARGGRIKYLERNRSLADTIGGLLAENDPMPVVVGSNPLDIMTHAFWRATGWDRHRFVGYALSETARVKDEIARLVGCRPDEVYCPTLGEHGEELVPVFSRLTVRGEPADLDDAERERVVEYANEIPYEVIDLRGKADSSRWVTGQGIARLVLGMLRESVDEPLGLSVPLDGEYGFEDVCLSVPVRLSADGWTEVVEWDLAEDERRGLRAASESVSADL